MLTTGIILFPGSFHRLTKKVTSNNTGCQMKTARNVMSAARSSALSAGGTTAVCAARYSVTGAATWKFLVN